MTVAGHPLQLAATERTIADLAATADPALNEAMATCLPTRTRLEPMIAAIRLGLTANRRADLLAYA